MTAGRKKARWTAVLARAAPAGSRCCGGESPLAVSRGAEPGVPQCVCRGMQRVWWHFGGKCDGRGNITGRLPHHFGAIVPPRARYRGMMIPGSHVIYRFTFSHSLHRL